MPREAWNEVFGEAKTRPVLAFVAAAFIALMVAMPAWADTTVGANVTAPVKVTFTPTVDYTFGADDSMTFTPEPLGALDEEGISLDTSGVSDSIQPVTLNPVNFIGDFEYDETEQVVIVPAGKTLTMTGNFDLTGVSYDNPGTYVYKITRTEASTKTERQSNPIEYFMFVNVVSETDDNSTPTGNLIISSVSFVESIDDQGVKQYEEVITTSPTHYTFDEYNKVTEALYAFEYTPVSEVSDLKITNAVKGSSADKDDEFEVTLTLTVPENTEWPSDGYAYVVYKDASLGAQDQSTTETSSYKKTDASAVFNLKHNEYVTFAALPVGTTYTIAVAGKEGYTTTATVKSTTSDGTVQTAEVGGTTVGAGMTVEQFTGAAADKAVIGSVANSNVTDIVNTKNGSTPTGILISNLPYILLIGIPVIALVAWFVVRRKRYARIA